MKKIVLSTLSILFICSCLITVSADDGYVWPISNQNMSQQYHSGHKAIDISAPKGTRINSAMSGEVVCASSSTPGSNDICSYCGIYAGYHVVIKQTDGIYAIYAHMSKVSVKSGDNVISGQKIGEVGSTGNSTGNHLHFCFLNQTDTGWFDLSSPIDPITKLTPFSKVYTDEITSTNAKIHGIFGCDGMSISSAGIYIGTNIDDMKKISETLNLGSGHPYKEVFYDLNKHYGKLTNDTKYFYQVWITHYGTEYKSDLYTFTAGDTSTGNSKAENTNSNPEKFNKVWVSNLGKTNAQINASIDLQWITEAGFYIGTSKDGMTKHPEKISSGMNVDNIFYDLNKWGVTLEESTTYYYQIYYIKNGTSYNSDVRTFTTMGCTHMPQNSFSEATCTKEGKIVSICLKCSEVLHESTIPAIGHSFDNGVITKNPTTTNTGIKTYTCKNCKETKEELIPLIEEEIHKHTQGSWIVEKEADCVATGKKVLKCSECSEVLETEIIAKLNHSFDNGVIIKEATDKEMGKKLYTCVNCGYAKVEDIPVNVEIAVIESPFTDVPKTQWYYSTIITVYQNKLMMGNSLTTFNPSGTMTLAEAITIASRIHCKNTINEDLNVLGGENWYDAYVNYAIENGIIKDTDFSNYSKSATRGEMAYIFSRCVTSNHLVEINSNIIVPDVYDDYKYAKEITALYKSGVVAGSDEIGRYYPERNISRAEVAMIVARLTNLVNRVKK